MHSFLAGSRTHVKREEDEVIILITSSCQQKPIGVSKTATLGATGNILLTPIVGKLDEQGGERSSGKNRKEQADGNGDTKSD
jgi:hypothetical protein